MESKEKFIYEGHEHIVSVNENNQKLLLRSDIIRRLEPENNEEENKMKVSIAGIDRERDENHASFEMSVPEAEENNFQSIEKSAERLQQKVMEGMLNSVPSNQQLVDTMLRQYNSEVDFTRKEALEEKKAILKSGNIWEKEIIGVARKTYKDQIRINEDGRIVRYIEIPNVVSYTVSDISNVADFQLIKVKAYGCNDTELLYCFHATIKGKLIQFTIRKTDLTVKAFRRQLIKNGVKIHVANADIMIVSERILAELIVKASEVTLPYAPGWNKIDGKWQWVGFDMISFKEVERELETVNNVIA